MYGGNVEMLRWLLTLNYLGDREDLLGLGFWCRTITANVRDSMQVNGPFPPTYPR